MPTDTKNLVSLPFSLPAITESGFSPVWTGKEFIVGNKKTPVLCYHETNSGWKDELTEMHENVTGSDHYIDHASRKYALSALESVLKKDNPVILEIGCSSGYFLEDLRDKAPHSILIGSDFLAPPLFKLAKRLGNVPIMQFDLLKCPLDSDIFDAVVLLNVLEHIDDDLSALRQVYRVLKPGGIATIEVPSGSHLYDFYDKHLMHRRRYNMSNLLNLVKESGFNVKYKSHLGFFLYPSFSIVKKRNRLKGQNMTDTQREQIVSNQIAKANTNLIMHAIMNLELILGKVFRYPFGVRCLLTIQKPIS